MGSGVAIMDMDASRDARRGASRVVMSLPRSLMLPVIAALLLLILPLASAQFPFFDGMWGHQQQQQQQQHPSGASQWAAHADSGLYLHHSHSVMAFG
jgi:hypothetical protein